MQSHFTTRWQLVFIFQHDYSTTAKKSQQSFGCSNNVFAKLAVDIPHETCYHFHKSNTIPKTMMKTAGTDAFREPVVGANRQQMFRMAHPF
jgi:hypothetical protein